MLPDCFLLFLIGYLNVVLVAARYKIYLGCLVPGFGEDQYGYQAAIELAAEMINNRSDILPDHEVVVVCKDTYGGASSTIRHVFEFVQRPKNQSIRLLIGPAWSKTTIPSHQACGSYKIVQLSYAASSVEFQNDAEYFTLFTNVPSTSAFNKARLSLIEYFGWKRVAILREYEDKLHNEAVNDLRNQIMEKNSSINLITIEGFTPYTKGHPRVQLENLQKLDARIIIGEFSAESAVQVFCEAYKLGMVGQKYVWLMPAGLSSAWIFSPNDFSKQHKVVKCNIRTIIEAADGFIMSDKIPIRQDSNRTLSGLTSETFMDRMHRRNSNPKSYTSYAFDSVWAAALLFQKSLSYPKFRPDNVKFEDIEARNFYAWALSKTQFEGLTGPHFFDRRQRLGTVRITQMRNINGTANLIQVGTFSSINQTESKLTLFQNQLNKLWKDGKVPVDEATKERRVLTYSVLELVFIGVLAGFCLLFCIFLLHFNICKRNHKVVRMSSPIINNVVLLGCFLCYVFVFLLGIDSRFVDDHIFGILCNVRLYVLAIAFSLAFGALFSKTWRVYKIFTAKRAIKKKLMRDFHLILFVLVLVIVDIIFITIWVIYNPLETKEVIFDELKDDSRDIITIPVLKVCECSHKTKLLTALFSYKGILLLFGVFLAWETRNVTIPALNDSRYIGMSVYNVVILSAIGVTVTMVLRGTIHNVLLYVLVSAVVLLSTTVTLTMVFAPKVYEYYFTPPDPQERTRTLESLQGSVGPGLATSANSSDVYQAYVKPKDVKHKWIQTEDFDQVHGKPILHSPAIHGHISSYSVLAENRNIGKSNIIMSSQVNNVGERVLTEGFQQDDERALTAFDVCMELCEGKMGQPSPITNDGFGLEDIQEKGRFHDNGRNTHL